MMSGVVLGQAELSTPVRAFDFGFMPPNLQLKHYFWIKSVGTDTVRIDDVKTGCACAVTSLEREWLAPGDSLELEVTWDVELMRGSILRAVRVFYNGFDRPLTMQLEGQVTHWPDSLYPLLVKPYRFEFGRTSQKDIDSIAFRIINKSNKETSVELLSKIPAECQLELPTTVPANSESTGYIKLKPEFRETEFKSCLTFLAPELSKTRVTVPIRRKIYQ